MMLIEQVNRFECENKHVFYVPLDLPKAVSEFSETLKKMKCPLCNCGRKEMRLSAKLFKIHS